MDNFLILTHGTRIVNQSYSDSHFTVPENFNIITFVKPNEVISYKTVKLLVTEFSNSSRDYFSQMNSIINETNLKNRVIQIREFEKRIIINYLFDEIEKDDSLKQPITFDENGISQFEKYLFRMNLYEINSEQIKDLPTLRSQLLYQLDRIKNFFRLEIRIYTQGTQAPMMNLDIKENDDGTDYEYTGTFRGIYNFNTIDYESIEYENYIENQLRPVQTNTIFKLQNYNDLSDNFEDKYNIFYQLKNNNINGGNLFLISCSIYDMDAVPLTKKSMKLFRQESLRRQGRIKRKYAINYNI